MRAQDEPAPREHNPIPGWLARVREYEGSDLLLVPGLPPMIRARKKLLPASSDPLGGRDILAALDPFVPSRLRDRYAAGEAVDVGFGLPGLGRFRMNLHRERGRCAAAIRALPLQIPSLQDLRFSHDISLLASLPRGLVPCAGRPVPVRPPRSPHWSP